MKGRRVPLRVHRLLKDKGDKRIGDTTIEQFIEMIRGLTTDDVVISLVGGNQHAVFSTIQHAQPFDFYEPGQEGAVDPKAEAVPYRMLAEAFGEGIRSGDGRSILALRSATSAKVVHVIPPPPKGDNAFIQNHHETRFAKEGIVGRGVSSPALRMKFWKMQTKVLEQLCNSIGVATMMPPELALDEEGFLARGYYANDATHANADYGELIIRQIEILYLPHRQDP